MGTCPAALGPGLRTWGPELPLCGGARNQRTEGALGWIMNYGAWIQLDGNGSQLINKSRELGAASVLALI